MSKVKLNKIDFKFVSGEISESTYKKIIRLVKKDNNFTKKKRKQR